MPIQEECPKVTEETFAQIIDQPGKKTVVFGNKAWKIVEQMPNAHYDFSKFGTYKVEEGAGKYVSKNKQEQPNKHQPVDYYENKTRYHFLTKNYSVLTEGSNNRAGNDLCKYSLGESRPDPVGA